jgi:hypothetical protein
LDTKTDNKGINCTVLLLPRLNFGLEIRLSNFSIYGMRDICKGRYISFSQPKSHNFPTDTIPASLAENNEFPIPELLSPLERKFCGKLEDYSKEERLLTFTLESTLSLLHSTSLNSDSPSLWYENGEKVAGVDESSRDDTIMYAKPSSGILLQISLPNLVKSRERFSLDLSSLNPCQRVTLADLDGEIKYSKNYGNEECSIVIHVPYGSRIITKMTLSRLSTSTRTTSETGISRGNGDGAEQEAKAEYSESNSINEESDVNYNNGNNSTNYYNYNDSDLDFESLESMDNSITQPSYYECPGMDTKSEEVKGRRRITNSSGGGVEGESWLNAGDMKRYMFIRAEDSVSGSEFTWCFDGNSNPSAQHKRAWKSSGNKVKIRFQLNYFDVFHLAYQSVRIPEITGECDRGWVKVDSGCVTLVEKASSWTNSEEFCQLQKGHLATISKESDEVHIQKIIKER